MNENGLNAAKYAYQRLVGQGIHPTYAAAAVGHLVEESGWFSPDVIAGKRRGDSGSAAYAAQWRAERLRNLENFAASQGRPLDLDTQLDFIVHEGKAGLDAGAARWYKEATAGQGNMNDAVAAFAHFERPQGYSSKNPYGIKTFNTRLSHAMKIAGATGNGEAVNMPGSLSGVFGVPGSMPAPSPGQTQAAADGYHYGFTPAASSAPARATSLPYSVAFQNDPYLEGKQ